jgi:hypothetical protein
MARGNLITSLLRPDDLLTLEFECINLTLDTTQIPPVLVRIQAGQPALIIVRFPPQHIGESFFIEPDSGVPAVGLPPIQSSLAGSTRLAFLMRDDVLSVPLTVEGLLSWTQFTPSLAANALTVPPSVNPPGVADPGAQQTAIELPFRLFLSPDASAGWKHALAAVTRDGRTEMWHTRLGVAEGNDVDESRRPVLRAIFALGTASDDHFESALTGDNRVPIALQSSDFTQAIVPEPLSPRLLMLSALGAWTDVRGAWDAPDSKVAAWRQVVAAGRDQYVRVVDRGFLFPFGHRAAKIQVTERKLEPIGAIGDGRRGAYLMTREFVVVSEAVRDYTTDPITTAYTFAGREMPFKNLRITTQTTPALDRDLVPPDFPQAGGGPFQFHIVAEDCDHQVIDFSMPLMFVSQDSTSDAIKKNNSDANRTADLRNQTVAFAPSSTGDTNLNTRLRTASITFDAQFDVTSLTPAFLPTLDAQSGAAVAIHAIDNLLGASGASGATVMTYHDIFLRNSFDSPNTSEVFARFPNLALNVPADKAGVATPRTVLNGLSRSLGPVPRVNDLVAGTLKPSDALDGNLLGGITLKDIVSADTSIPIESQIPRLITNQVPDSIQTSFTWEPKVARINDPSDPSSQNPSLSQLITTGETTLTVTATMVAPLNGSAPSFTSDGTLSNFALNLLDIVVVTFEKLRFHVERGNKVDLSPEGVHVEFVGALSFVNQLAELLPPEGFSDPPVIQVTQDGITAGYSLGLPTVGVGVFSLENVALSAELQLPFTQPVGLRLAFSERFHPFLATVSLVGGGGFLAVALNANGIEIIEGSLELGGNITVSLAIVQANAHVLMGFHFAFRQDKSLDFSAYIRVGASVSLLGIVSVSIDIYLGLGFSPRKAPGIIGVVSGIGAVIVGVHVLFVHKSFTLTFERHFDIPARANVPLVGGVPLPILADPSFDDLVSIDDWQRYCQAFA